ncbi:hypothetical protein [Hymenobacter sp.]|uniref:hypothetical protein n=1 Tax=Hymenobacter sp. TaxID=1898978 RepID=UPI0038D5122E
MPQLKVILSARIGLKEPSATRNIIALILRMSSDHINYPRIEQAIGFLTCHFLEQPSLEEVAARVELSPFHFQRLFVERVGLSPKKFRKYLTAYYLKGKIRETQSVLEAADLAGLSSQPSPST